MKNQRRTQLIGAITFALSQASFAGGPFAIDHRLNYDVKGIWNTSYQDAVVVGTALAVVGGALWEGGDSRLGRTLWQSVDSLAFSSVTAEALKYGLSRASPAQTSNPDSFFNGGRGSFPSSHVAALSGAITPIVLEYGPDYPLVYGLEGLVVYEMIGRVKAQEHWQSDVLIGAVLGTAFGFYAHNREQPLILGYLPEGFFVGLRQSF